MLASCLQVYAGLITKGKSQEQAAELSADEKKRRVVLKRVNLDRVEVRANFLKSGTMAKVGCCAGSTGCVCQGSRLERQTCSSCLPKLGMPCLKSETGIMAQVGCWAGSSGEC